ncbi:MAG: peptidoglycan recognition family protein, partial [Patescibacteria group bacterium]
MRRPSLIPAALVLVFVSLAAERIAPALWEHHGAREISFAEPIDALSVGGDRIMAEVSGFDGKGWTAWEELLVDDEQDPLSRESNLVVFPAPVSKVRLRGNTDVDIHPIRVSHEPSHYTVAARGSVAEPRVLSRENWGADESLLYYTKTLPASSGNDSDSREADNGNGSSAAVSTRVRDCQEAQRLYPEEFRIAERMTEDGAGRTFLWPQEYSPSVRLIVVHHTAGTVSTDSRPAVERMRAIYTYHAKNRGWGDIGYHYVIDEAGKIYQGRAGGEAVIGGHAYCNNINTVSIALMGNFDAELPRQEQVRSLQWLADTLAQQYGIDLGRNVMFHGKNLPAVVGHRDLLSTSCPGHYLYGAMDQVRRNVRSGDLAASVRFPPPPSSSSRSSASFTRNLAPTEGIAAMGSTALMGRPGGETVVALRYQAGAKPVKRGGNLGAIKRSSPRIGVWVAKGEGYVRARTTLLAPDAIGSNQSTIIRVKIQIPRDRGTHTLSIGPVKYAITTEGRRLPAATTRGNTSPQQAPMTRTGPVRPTRSSSSSIIGTDYPVIQQSQTTNIPPLPVQGLRAPQGLERPAGETAGGGERGLGGEVIRIRLTDSRPAPLDTMTVEFPGVGLVNGASVNGGVITLTKQGESCTASRYGTTLTAGVVRLDLQGGIHTVTSMVKAQNRYRGALECRVV